MVLMKIKCPICVLMEGTDNDHPNEHEEAYHILLEKIHEKMEEYKGKDCRDDPSVSVEHLLKSLLENKK